MRRPGKPRSLAGAGGFRESASSPPGGWLDVAWGVDASVDARGVTGGLASELLPVAADLVEVAAAVHTADRLTRRTPPSLDPYGLSWRRTLSVRVGVRCRPSWSRREVRQCPTELLKWLSGDAWRLDFRDNDGPAPTDDGRGFLFTSFPQDPFDVCLISGGLDSTAGLAVHLDRAPDRRVLAVSVATNTRMASVQERTLAHLCRRRGPRVQPVTYWLQMRRPPAETTQRTRAFVFLAAGAAVALTAGKRELTVFENGIGAYNLPYVRSQIGPMATRAMHPRTLALFARLVSLLANSPFSVTNPSLWLAKAELLSTVSDADSDALVSSVSCDFGFASRVGGGRLCGRCTSCLLRRQSLLAAGLAAVDAADDYRLDVCAGQPSYLPELDAMVWQVVRLRAALADHRPWPRLVRAFPELLDAPAATLEDGRTQLIRLYRTYCAEWSAVQSILAPTVSPRPEPGRA
jgi:7-cyano-7-deazaguanine synthase in queuosine biosynthesis